MKRKIKRIVLFLALMMNLLMMSQEQNLNSFIIVTFKFERKGDLHSTKEYFWITETESINSIEDLILFPLYFDEFSKEDLNECMGQRDVNIFTMYNGENFVLEKELIDNINTLKEFVQTKNIKVQSISKKWENNKLKEKVTVYITPVLGIFCSSNIAEYSSKEINYKGFIYIPLSNFAPNPNFFNTQKWKLIKNFDFSIFKFKNKL